MADDSFIEWFLTRVKPFRDVASEKLLADREAVSRLQEYNSHYRSFMDKAVLPAIDELVRLLAREDIAHSACTWGGQLALRVHLAWRWGELLVGQDHEDCVTFSHHVVAEGEAPAQDSSEDHDHTYDLRDPLPAAIAAQEIQFFLGRLAQDLEEKPQEDDEEDPTQSGDL